MATRVPKTGASGGVEFAQGSQPLHIAELDGDLDAIFGSITNANVAVGANIATSKLAVDGGIVAGMLGTNSVTTLKIADQPNGVTTAKLNIGATTPSGNSAQASFDPILIFPDGTEQTVVSFSLSVVRAGRVFAIGSLTGLSTGLATHQLRKITVRLKRGATILATQIVNEDAGAIGANLVIPWAAAPVALEAPGPGTYTYSLTAQITAGTEFSVNQVSSASLVAVEFA